MAAVQVVQVNMWGTTIGYLYQPETGAISFQYDEAFVKSGIQVSPLQMPLSSATYSFPSLNEATFFGLPGLVADSLPDRFGTLLLESYLSSIGRSKSSLTELERLCYTGTRGMGALEYQPATQIASAEARASLSDLADIAAAILDEKGTISYEDKAGLIAELMESSSSVGGARAKTLIALNAQTGEVRSGKLDLDAGFEHWILKFGNVKNNADKDEIPDEDGYTRVEYAYHLMAQAAGIEMTECRLRVEGGVAHFMTKRFDRDAETGAKIHAQTLCALNHMDFNIPRVYSYEDAFSVLRKMNLSYGDMLQLFARMVFNDLARNFDDHTKNISFLMDKRGSWRLAPAYDVTFSYKPSSRWVSAHQMLVNGKSRGIDDDDFLAVALTAGIRRRDALGAIERVKSAVSRWMAFAQDAGLSEQRASEIAACL